MSGWLAVWARNNERFDRDRWNQAIIAGAGENQDITQRTYQCGGMAAWRRHTGEFIYNGTITLLSAQRWLAWVGQTIEDEGDTSETSMQALAGGNLERAAQLNGPFAAAVLDTSANELTIWTDRHSHYPVYVTRSDGILAASTCFESIMPWVDSPRLDIATIDLLLRCGEVIDRRTLLLDVESLPGGTRLHTSANGAKETRYWRLTCRPDYSLDFDTTARDVADRMRRSVRRIQHACPSLSVPLSGGLDSRLLLGLCEEPKRIPSVTWGEPGCRDLKYASYVAERTGSPHTSCTWNAEAMASLWEDGVVLTAGCFIVRDMFVFPFVDLLALRSDVTLNGLAGDVFLGGNFVKSDWIREKSLAALARRAWRWRVSEWGEHFVDGMLRKESDEATAFDLWSASILQDRCSQNGCIDARPMDRLYVWLMENRIFRFTNSGTALLRSAVESHAPFWDRDVVELLSRVPAERKLRHRFYLRVLKQACPRAAATPWQRTGIPPSWGYQLNLTSLAYHRVTKLAGRRIGLDPFPRMAYARPDEWFRGPWRRAAEEILLSERSLSRGLFDADGLRRAWAEHQKGADLSKLVSAAITVELFCRRFMDDEQETINTRNALSAPPL